LKDLKNIHKLNQNYEVQSEKKEKMVKENRLKMNMHKSDKDFSAFNGGYDKKRDQNKQKREIYEEFKEEDKHQESSQEKKNDKEKKIKILRKKMRQIEYLEGKLEKGETLTKQEREKFEKKKEFEEELEIYLKNPSP